MSDFESMPEMGRIGFDRDADIRLTQLPVSEHTEPKLYPKTLTDVGNFAEEVADKASFMGMATGVLKGMHAAEFQKDAKCIGEKPLMECGTTKRVIQEMVSRTAIDKNDGHTGWVGYEPANVTCEDCDQKCSARVFWEDGKPTERIRFMYFEPFEPDVVIKLDLKSYGRELG